MVGVFGHRARSALKMRVRVGSMMTIALAITSRPASAIPVTIRSARRREFHESGTLKTTIPGCVSGGKRSASAKSRSPATVIRPSAVARA